MPGVPLIDSPFFDEQLARLNPDAEVKRIATDLREKALRSSISPIPNSADAPRRSNRAMRRRRSISPNGAPASRDLRNQDAWRNDPNVRSVAANPAILRLLETLYGRPAFRSRP